MEPERSVLENLKLLYELLLVVKAALESLRAAIIEHWGNCW